VFASLHPPYDVRYDEILIPDALAFLAALHRAFDGERHRLLALRAEKQKRFDRGELPDFLPETKAVREGDWTVAPIPADLQDRRVEITGPVDRKMVINALNCGAKVFMADFEDANSPTWSNRSRARSTSRTAGPASSPSRPRTPASYYALKDKTAVLIIPPARLAPAGGAHDRRRRGRCRARCSTSASTSSTTPRRR
jgi:malate synthase